jgi:toxin ParE1/3/4
VSYTILWSDRALSRVQELADFVAQHSEVAARRLVEELFDRVQVLSDHPQLGIRFPDSPTHNVRILYVDRMRVYYLLNDEQRTISICTVQHGRQQPLSLEAAVEEAE